MKLKEQHKLLEMFKNENDSKSAKMDQIESDLSKKLEEEQARLKEQLTNKDKHYETFIEELTDRHKRQTESDRNEIERLRTKIDDLENAKENSKKVTTSLLSSPPNIESNESTQNVISNLKLTNQQLTKQLEDLKFAYDDVKDEKAQLYLSLNELKQKQKIEQHSLGNFSSSQSDMNEMNKLNNLLKSKDKIISDLEARLAMTKEPIGFAQNYSNNNKTSPSLSNYYSRSLMAESSDHESLSNRSLNNYNSMCLESTEIDYLRQIVYSYMMGTDPVVSIFE